MLPSTRSQSSVALFADDTKLFKAIDLPGAKNELQADLNSLQKWSLDWGTEFNTSKCQVLNVSKKKFKPSAEYELDGHQLECVSCVKDLGVTVSCDLSWSKHIKAIVSRATKYILSYPQDLKYADWSIKLNILPLEFRRDISDLCLLFKSRTGAITTDVNHTYEPGYKSRNYDVNNYNLIIKHKQDYFRNSFF